VDGCFFGGFTQLHRPSSVQTSSKAVIESSGLQSWFTTGWFIAFSGKGAALAVMCRGTAECIIIADAAAATLMTS
jgi:hypothetical protein